MRFCKGLLNGHLRVPSSIPVRVQYEGVLPDSLEEVFFLRGHNPSLHKESGKTYVVSFLVGLCQKQAQECMEHCLGCL